MFNNKSIQELADEFDAEVEKEVELRMQQDAIDTNKQSHQTQNSYARAMKYQFDSVAYNYKRDGERFKARLYSGYVLFGFTLLLVIGLLGAAHQRSCVAPSEIAQQQGGIK